MRYRRNSSDEKAQPLFNSSPNYTNSALLTLDPKKCIFFPNYLFYPHWIHPLMSRSCKSHIMLSLIKANSSGGVGGGGVDGQVTALCICIQNPCLSVCRKSSAVIFLLAPSGCCNRQTGEIKRRRSAQQYAAPRLPKKLDTYKHVG